MKKLCVIALVGLVYAGWFSQAQAASAVQYEFETRYDRAARRNVPGFSIYDSDRQLNTAGFIHANGVEIRNGRTYLVSNGGLFIREGKQVADLRQTQFRETMPRRSGWGRTNRTVHRQSIRQRNPRFASSHSAPSRTASAKLPVVGPLLKGGCRLLSGIFGKSRHAA